MNKKKLRVDIDTLKYIFYEDRMEATSTSTYLDRETGEIFSEKDMFPEEIRNRKRFLKIPSEQVFLVTREQIVIWFENALQLFSYSYDETLPPKARDKLEKALQHDNYLELVSDIIRDLEREINDDHLFGYWMDCMEKQEAENLKTWLTSKQIDLAD